DDHIRISASPTVSNKQIRELLLAKQEWILKQWLAKQNSLKRSPREFIEGEHFPYRGRTLELKINRHACKTISVFREGQVVNVCLPQDLLESDFAPNVQAALISWYKAEARRIFKDKLDMLAKRMRVTYQTFRLKDQRTRWGSCSSKGNLNLNWRIIMSPDEVIDYVIIHELAHLTYLDHSDQFWQRVAAFMPEFVHWKTWLKNHGQELTI
ncbi:MAG: SprT family zinc-dependent metalloprotease, partial [Bacillota bacterium]|nr:SprT family zinc-dependent metalloprotease [Bacillota bacterium]